MLPRQIADTTAVIGGAPELSAAILQFVVTLALASLCAVLFRVYRRPVYAWWATAWTLYLLRLGAIGAFLLTHDWFLLYWHQVLTGWTALAVLATAIVFERGQVRRWFVVAAVFPPLWSYVAIYRLDTFLLAALPAVMFLAGATLSTGIVFFRYARQARSLGASVLAIAFFLWGMHHLDYPFLRERGAWVPWGYYLDVLFQLAAGVGILLLVADDLRRGLDAMTTLSGELQTAGARERPGLVDALLEQPLALPAVSGAAVYSVTTGLYEAGAGDCQAWSGHSPAPPERARLAATVATHRATTHTEWCAPDQRTSHPFAALLPIPEGAETAAVLVVAGDVRTPFAVLDETFLTALGQQIGGALANSALTERLRQRSADLERLSARMVQQHEEERRRLSRELHDETAQVLSALKMELGVLRKAVAPADQHRIDDALTLVDVGIKSIRAVTNELRPALLDDLGLGPAVRSLATDFGERTGIPVQLTLPDAWNPAMLGPDAELALFRAVQEGLSNIARHARAGHVAITLTAHAAEVELMISDDGVGIDPAVRRDGMGLTGMRERVAALRGSLVVESTPGAGTTLRIRIPARKE